MIDFVANCTRPRIITYSCGDCEKHGEAVYRCGRKFCSKTCEFIWSTKVRQRIEPYRHFLEDKFRFLTLTISKLRSVEELAPMHKLFIKSFAHLRRLTVWRCSTDYGVYTLELVGNRLDGLNLHLDALVSTIGDGLYKDQLQAEWSRIVTGDTEQLLEVDVRPFDTIDNAINYITKGSRVFGQEIQEQFKRKKCFNLFGFTNQEKRIIGLELNESMNNEPRKPKVCYGCGSTSLKIESETRVSTNVR